jgi:omega-hydroxy-beta-dihydromenaquinone-9 sulfotransferase
MDPCAFPLRGRGHGQITIARPMDGLAICSHSPQEDEFALLALGVESAYRAFWMPQRLPALSHTLDSHYWLEHDDWLVPWEAFLRAVRTQAGAQAVEPLILKSPNHTFRIPSILRRFPTARFVWMLRDPVQVAHSNRKMWTSMFVAHGIAAAVPAMLDDFLAQAMQRCASALHEALAQEAPGRCVFVSHKTLLSDPDHTVMRAASVLGLPPSDCADDVRTAVKRVRDGRVETYPNSVPRGLELACAELARVQERAKSSPFAIA